ncbi:MAG TPA: alpha-ketoacid dehydrogenase subunit beta [Candidatus Kapabacteria bacterium]|nr:alpha-ketoacid dehydrogenase subunit beta [Candidatus Kapabacteria bacterium]
MTRTYIEAITDALRYEMKRDKTVFCIGEDIGAFGGAFKATKGLFEEFGAERVIDTPIAEAGIIGAAIGASLCGYRPVAEMQFSDFITNGFNEVVTVAATTAYRWGIPVPIVIRCPSGAGISGGPFHSRNPEVWFAHQPGLKVVCPSTPEDAKGLLLAAIRDPNPVMYFEHKRLYRSLKAEVPDGEFVTELGKACIARVGTDATIITYGGTVPIACELADELRTSGKASIEVLDLRSLVPLDREAIFESVRKTNRVLILHEDNMTAGFGAEISALVTEHCFESLDAPLVRIAAADVPVPFAPNLEKKVLPSKDKLRTSIESLLSF